MTAGQVLVSLNIVAVWAAWPDSAAAENNTKSRDAAAAAAAAAANSSEADAVQQRPKVSAPQRPKRRGCRGQGQCTAAARVPEDAAHVVGGTGGWPEPEARQVLVAASLSAFPPLAWLSFALVGVLYGRALIRDSDDDDHHHHPPPPAALLDALPARPPVRRPRLRRVDALYAHSVAACVGGMGGSNLGSQRIGCGACFKSMNDANACNIKVYM
ncbi:hypothetical protein MY10362_009097 [Beauveria mimosiformis]